MASPSATASEPGIRPRVFVYPLGVWLLMAAVAVLNGIFRELFIVPRIGTYPGHVLSTILLIVAILLLAFLYFSKTSITYGYGELALVGGSWTILTVGFEFLIGYFEGTPPAVTIGQYDVLSGQVWILVPITLLVSPLLFGWYLTDRRGGNR